MQQNSYHSVNRKVKATEYFENKKDWFCKSKHKIVTEIFRNKKKKIQKKGMQRKSIQLICLKKINKN